MESAVQDAPSADGGARTPSSLAAPEGTRRAAMLAAVVTSVVFLPSLAAGYVYDDVLLICENPYAQSLRHLARGFRTHLWDVYAFGSGGIGLRYYRPLVTVSYILNWWAGHGAAWTFHLVNSALHVAATFLAVRVAARWTESATLGLVAGLLFGLHPSRTESVLWISGRTDVMMAVFALVAVELAHASARGSTRRSVALGSGAVAATVAAILCKEAGVLAALFVAVDCLRSPSGTPERARLTRLSIALGALGVAYVGLRAAFYPVGSTMDATPRYGLLTVWSYVERVIAPWPQTFFYRPVEARQGIPQYPTLLLALGALSLSGLVFLLLRAWRRDRVAFAILVAAVALVAPLLNFTYTGIFVTASDHFLYLPLLFFATGSLRLHRGPALRATRERVAQLAFVGVLAIYAAIDGLRVFDYRDDSTFWQHEIEINPDNPVALQNMSGIISRSGELVTARTLMEHAVSPAATRFFLLTGDKPTRLQRLARLLALKAALLPDGDVVTLGQLFAELDTVRESLHSFGGSFVIAERSAAAEAALVGTRIGRLARAKRLIDGVPDELLWHLSSPPNFALTLARVGDFSRAMQIARKAQSPPVGIVSTVPPELESQLSDRIRRAEELLRSAPAHRPTLQAALGFAELGAYLQALRILRPRFDERPHAPDIDPIYVQLLVAARLEREALATAAALLGPEHGLEVVERYAEGLPPRVRALAPPPEPSPWWPPPGDLP